MMVGMAMLGAAMPMGGQTIQASLVDLKTGQVVWYNFMVVPAGTVNLAASRLVRWS